jgi:C-terminal processing protease CtpA/Prc
VEKRGISMIKLVLLLIFSFSLATAQDNPITYLNEAIDKLQNNWEKADTVDWKAIRSEVLAKGENAQTIEETYPIIRELLRELGDSWNYLSVPGENYEVPRDQTGFRVMLPDWVLVYVFDESPAALAGMKVGDQIIAVNGKPVNYRYAWDTPRVPTGGGAIYDSCKFEATHYCDLLREIYAPGSRLQIRRAGEEESIFMEVEGQVEWNLMFPVGKRFGDIGYIELPPLKIEEQEYKNIVQQAIQDMEQSPTCGWIVDLRRHAGGEGPFVESVESLIKVNSDDQPSNSQAAVAILLSPITASMGEYTADIIDAYAYNSNTFGEETWGNHPIVVPFRLSNKASLGLTTESGSLTPDVEVKNNWRYFQSEDDPVIQAASEWLMQQPSCSGE